MTYEVWHKPLRSWKTLFPRWQKLEEGIHYTTNGDTVDLTKVPDGDLNIIRYGPDAKMLSIPMRIRSKKMRGDI